MEDELVQVCFCENCYRGYNSKRFGSKWFVSTSWVSNWKEMTPKDFDKWMSCMVRKCRIDYRIVIVEIRNETIKVHDWQEVGNEVEPMVYEMAEIPEWCKELVF